MTYVLSFFPVSRCRDLSDLLSKFIVLISSTPTVSFLLFPVLVPYAFSWLTLILVVFILVCWLTNETTNKASEREFSDDPYSSFFSFIILSRNVSITPPTTRRPFPVGRDQIGTW